jgi:uncharacterized protein (TIGR00730 family)
MSRGATEIVYNVRRDPPTMAKNPEPNGSTLRAAIDSLMSVAELGDIDPRSKRMVRSMIETALAFGSDGVAVRDLKLVDAAMSEIRDALERFAPYGQTRKVTVFGSARTRQDDPEYVLAREFGRRVAEAGFMVITGAGPGIMEAANAGAGRDMSFGVNIKLPFEQMANPVIAGDEKLTDFKYFFTRKLFFLKESSGLVLFPGGFGTHDEGFETLTLIQTGKSQMVPIIFIEEPKGTYWKTFHQYVQEHLLRKGMISPEDLYLYTVTDDLDEAVGVLRQFYRVYHSARMIRGRLVIRTNHPVEAPVLEDLSNEFADILGQSHIRSREPYEEEQDEPELLHLPRLVLQFDMRSYGRMRRLIDRLNERG